MKPYYSEAGIEIYHGKAEEVLPELAASFDLVFTSPPYNKGIRWEGTWQGPPSAGGKAKRFRNGYGVHNDAMPIPDYIQWQREILTALWRVIVGNGAIFYNHKPRVINGELWLPLVLNPSLPLRQIIVWQTGGGVNFMPGAYLPSHEWIMLFAKPEFRLASPAAAREGDVWTIRPAQSTPTHPCPFPIELPLRAIRSCGSKRILDPFMGTGTTLEAALLCGSEAVGIEIDERHCEHAANRLRQGVLFGIEAAA